MGCKLGKDSSLPLLKKLFLSTSPFDLVSEAHPAPLLSKGGSSVYVIFDRTMKKLTKIKVFRSDSGGEYISAAFRTLLASTHFTYKALSQRSCPHTPQQNGVAERKHRHILETARSLLLSASVPSPFWAEAVCSDCRIFFEPNTFLCHLWSVFESRFSTPPDYEELRVYRERMWW